MGIRVSNIQRFSVKDGPGIRTTVFTKGCNLRCEWCHNPETQHVDYELQYFRSKCIMCGSCDDICTHARFDSEKGFVFSASECDLCGKCVKNCPAKAINMSGCTIEEDELFESILRDKPFYDISGGGATFSGGEPLLQSKDIAQVMKRLRKQGVHVAVDTALCVDYCAIEDVIDFTNLFLVDVKAFHKDVHQKLTGMSNELMLKNLSLLMKTDKDIWIRIPVIPSGNEGELPYIAEYLKTLEKSRFLIELVPFHDMGAIKYESLNRPYRYAGKKSLSAEELKEYAKPFMGFNTVKYK